MDSLVIKKNFLLKNISTLGIGGEAKGLIVVHTHNEILKAIVYCQKANQDYIIVGKGSNVLFSDEGFDGIVILNKVDFCQDQGQGSFYVGAGHSFSLLGTHTARAGWSGLEFAAGIPASVGGAIFMNAGANGQETCEHLTAVEIVTDEGRLQLLQKKEMTFGYRFSTFQMMPKLAIVAAYFNLKPSLEARHKQQQIIAYRTKTQPYGHKSAGCIFQNPVGTSAGAIIEECKLKGHAIGDAAISDQHANFIINRGQARAHDILALIDSVQEKVKKQKNIDLKVEIQIIPYQLKNT